MIPVFQHDLTEDDVTAVMRALHSGVLTPQQILLGNRKRN